MKWLITATFGMLMGAAVLCHAEPRWCSVSLQGAKLTLLYPPIAKAARVQGVVLAHLVYGPNGKVIQVEPISGPGMLADSVKRQALSWTLSTGSKGDELCMSLLIANFRLSDDLFTPTELSREPPPPSTIKLTIEAVHIVISDPAPTITPNPFEIMLKPFRWIAKHLIH